MPEIKLRVPSMGSITHLKPVLLAFSPVSSPQIPSWGRDNEITFLMAFSAALSASVTGSKACSSLLLTSMFWRKYGRMASRARSAASLAKSINSFFSLFDRIGKLVIDAPFTRGIANPINT